jgi:hypothetical protein
MKKSKKIEVPPREERIRSAKSAASKKALVGSKSAEKNKVPSAVSAEKKNKLQSTNSARLEKAFIGAKSAKGSLNSSMKALVKKKKK